VSEAVAAYHALLEDEGVAAESVGVLQGAQAEHRLVFGGHPLCSSVRPNLVDRSRYERVVTASHAVQSAFLALESALLTDADLRAELDLDADEERLALADPGCSVSSPTSRLDAFFADEMRYIENNAETPAGIAYNDNLTAVFDLIPVMQQFREQYAVRPLLASDHLLDALLRAFNEWGRASSPVVAIVDWPGLPTLTEFEMFREFFESRGVPTHICEPAQMEFCGGRLYACGAPVNLVYKRVLISELLASDTASYQPLHDAYLAGAVCCVNTFRAKLLDKKMSLALLSDEQYASLYTPAQQDAIARHIPWTRRVREAATTWRGEPVADLPAYICAHRERLVLKPNDDYGGKGVVLGWTTEAHDWEQAVQVALTQSYVVQEAVATPREPFPVALGGEMRFLDLTVDIDPYLFYGEVGGCLTRLSSSALLNVTAGSGSVVPTYVVDGPR
jgi:uncharacterized circularly permuted ATP-grasp superfamily protein